MQIYFCLPDLAFCDRDSSNLGSLPIKSCEVDVSATSHARERFNNVSPSSCPHWERKFKYVTFFPVKNRKKVKWLSFIFCRAFLATAQIRLEQMEAEHEEWLTSSRTGPFERSKAASLSLTHHTNNNHNKLWIPFNAIK